MSGTLPEYSGLVRWTINDVGQWLSSNAFPEYCRSFREAGIDGVKFVELDETVLNRMRTPMNKRSKLMSIIKSIKKPDLSSVQNIISSRAPASPRPPQRDYHQKAAAPPTSAPHIDSGIDDSGSGTDDDYEWAASDFEDDDGPGHDGEEEEGYLRLVDNLAQPQNRVSYQMLRQDQTTHQDSDSSPDDDYENTKEQLAPPVPGREAHKEKNSEAPKGTFSVASLKNALNDFKQNSVRLKGHQNVQDGPEEDYDQPDLRQPPPQPSRGRTSAATPVSSQSALPSRPARRGQQAPPPEEEQPTYEETDDHIEPPLPSRPGRRAQPAPPAEQPPPPQPSRPGRRTQQPPPPQDEQPSYEETDMSDLAPEDVYEDPDNPTQTTPMQPPPPPRGGKRVMAAPPPSQNTRRPPTVMVNEPEEFYEVPSELPEAPKPPIDDQPTYEELDEEEQQRNQSNHRHKGKTTPSKPPAARGRMATPASDSDTEDYEKPNQPTAPIPTRFPSKQKGGRPPVPPPTEDLPGYMDMVTNESQNPDDDIYVVPDDEDEKKKPSKAAPPPVKQGNRDLPKTPGSAPQFRLPARQPDTPPVIKSNKKEPKKEPVVAKPTPRGLPPAPKGGGARPLPTVPPVNDQFEDEVDYMEEDLSRYDWYRGKMTRQDGDAKLKQNSQNGMFAIRDSSKKTSEGDPRPYTLMIYNDLKVYNLPIRKRLSDGHYAMGNPKPREETFPKLADLVAFFSKRMIVLQGSGQTHLKMPIP